MTFAVVAPYITVAAGVNSLTGGGITKALGFGSSSPSGQQVTQAADPFSPYRADMAKQYAAMNKPGGTTDINSMPGFTQFNTGVMQPALQASQRAAAATGNLYSGGQSAALQNQAQKGYYGFMTDYMNRLAQGSGATNNPATAVGMGVNQGNLNNAGVMQGLGGLATGLSGLAGMYGNSGAANYNSYSPSWIQAASQEMPSLQISPQQLLDPQFIAGFGGG